MGVENLKKYEPTLGLLLLATAVLPVYVSYEPKLVWLTLCLVIIIICKVYFYNTRVMYGIKNSSFFGNMKNILYTVFLQKITNFEYIQSNLGILKSKNSSMYANHGRPIRCKSKIKYQNWLLALLYQFSCLQYVRPCL